MNPPDKSRLLQPIAAIETMERGKLSAFTFKERPGVSGPYHKLQYWRNGKNHTRYVSEASPGTGDRAGWPRPVSTTDRAVCRFDHCGNPPKPGGLKKKACPPEIRLVQEEVFQHLIASFQAEESLLICPTGFGGRGRSLMPSKAFNY
jgi:hypothetical protein